jgi:hypothetical protein
VTWRSLWRFAACAITIVCAAGMHVVFSRVLAGEDPIAAFVGHPGARIVAASAALVLSRLFLLFLAPGWVMHLLVTSLVFVTGKSVRRLP